MKILSGYRVPLGDNTLTPLPYSQGWGLFGMKYNHNTSSPRDSGISTPITFKPLTVRGSKNTPLQTYNLITLITIHAHQRNIPIYWQWSSPLQSILLIMPDQDFQPIPGNMVKSHIFCECLLCIPKSFPPDDKSQS